MKEKLKIPEKTEEEIDINDFKFLEIWGWYNEKES
jgi:hypothetical protein